MQFSLGSWDFCDFLAPFTRILNSSPGKWMDGRGCMYLDDARSSLCRESVEGAEVVRLIECASPWLAGCRWHQQHGQQICGISSFTNLILILNLILALVYFRLNQGPWLYVQVCTGPYNGWGHLYSLYSLYLLCIWIHFCPNI